MNNNYYRITGYCKEKDFCFIIDCYGMFEKLWQFSSFLIQKGLQVLEVGNDTKFIDVNIDRIEQDSEKLCLHAIAKGMPEYITQMIDNTIYKAIKVADKVYVPDQMQII
jgi:hypothetical protein